MAASSGNTKKILASLAVLGLAAGIAGLGSYATFVITVRLPTSAGNTFQTLSSTVQFDFTGTQRAATAK